MSEFKRLTKIEYGYLLVLAAKARSEDEKTQVSAVGFDKDFRIISTGYNGWKSGFVPPLELNLEENREKKGEMITHAESNALSFAKEQITHLFLSISPCFACSKVIVSKNIPFIYYLEEYHRESKKHKEVFDFYGVKYFQATREEKLNIKEYLLREGLKL